MRALVVTIAAFVLAGCCGDDTTASAIQPVDLSAALDMSAALEGCPATYDDLQQHFSAPCIAYIECDYPYVFGDASVITTVCLCTAAHQWVCEK